PHTQYQYSPEGNLVAVTDALGNVMRYEYSGHLMVREIDRNGRSFYFGYDGNDSGAWCVRTWGDKGIFDTQLQYDKAKRVTIVKNSLGEQTVYRMNDGLLPVERVDAHGAKTKFAFDSWGRKVGEIDPTGSERRWEYDPRGNCTRVVNADATELRMEYDARDLR